MALSVDPSSLTAANLAAQKAALAKRRSGLDATAKVRRDISTQLKQATAGRMNPLLIQKLRGRLATATKQVGAQQKTYADYAHGTYQPFESAYKQLGSLDQANPTLDGVLNQLLPFDPESASDRLGAQSELNQRLLAVKTGKDQLAQDYSQGMRSMETAQPDRFRSILSNFAGRGLANSSGYATAYGNEQADYTDRRNQLDSANQRGLAQAGLDESGAQADYLSSIAGILSGATGRLAGNAGNLGMAGNTNLPLLLELARRRLAGGA